MKTSLDVRNLLLELYNCIPVRALVFLWSGCVLILTDFYLYITCIIAITRGLFHAPQCSSAAYIQAEQKHTP